MKKNKITYNLPQLYAVFSRAIILVLEWARGTGKSTIIGRRIYDLVQQLPRGKAVMVGSTYVQILTRTLPSTISGLEMHGLIKDRHYFVGRRPPANWGWPEPYEPPLSYKNFIIFYNGFGIQLLSQDRPGDGRGLNIDAVLADEAALLNYDDLNTDVLATNRGNDMRVANYPDGSWKYFKDCWLHHSIMFVTSTPLTAKGKWIFKFEEQKIMEPEKVDFIRAASIDNKENLNPGWFELMKSTMPEFMYKAEILNIRLKNIDDGFYPLLNEEQHCYSNYNNEFFEQDLSKSIIDSRGDADVDPNAPLIAGLDWGKNINCLVIAQRPVGELRFVKNFYVKFPKIIDDLIVEEFVPYYKHHKNKIIYLHYDNSGNIHQANSKLTYAQHVEAKLKENGWKVVLMTKGGKNTLHEDKYLLWIKMLSSETTTDVVSFNENNCKELWISMTNAPAKQGNNESIKKDKKSERSKSLDQAHATHFSDAGDVILHGLYSKELKGNRRTFEAGVR